MELSENFQNTLYWVAADIGLLASSVLDKLLLLLVHMNYSEIYINVLGMLPLLVETGTIVSAVNCC
jgi:hypothetical protein